MSDPIDKLSMPASALAALAKAVPTDVLQVIIRDNGPRAAPTPPAPKNIVDSLVERFAPSPPQGVQLLYFCRVVDDSQKNVDKPNHPHRVLSRKTVYDVVVCDIAKCWNDPSHELSETALVIRIIARHPKYGSR